MVVEPGHVYNGFAALQKHGRRQRRKSECPGMRTQEQLL